MIWLIGYEFSVGVFYDPDQDSSFVIAVLLFFLWPVSLGNLLHRILGIHGHDITLL